MPVNTTYRSDQEEIMDTLAMQGIEMERVFQDINLVNAYLGGNKITLDGIRYLLANIPKEREIVILDMGCGDGEMLVQCARYARKNKRRFKLIGVDLNAQIIEEAGKKIAKYPEISLMHQDVFSEEFAQTKVDIFLCTLTLHHFKDQQINTLLTALINRAKVGIVINDLHRSKLAYVLFKMFSHIFLKTGIAKNDGLVSILRGFKRHELKAFSKSLDKEKHTISWKWAFRYQWIIQKQ